MTIEEIKKAFQNKFGGESCWASDEVWNFFLPHLQPTEAVEDFVVYCNKELDKSLAKVHFVPLMSRFLAEMLRKYLAERGKSGS